MRIAALVLVLVSLHAAARNLEDELPFGADPASRQGRVRHVVQPEYPPNALARGIQGSVDVVGIINGAGQLEHIAFRPVTPESAVFIPAVDAVAREWTFRLGADEQCQPKSEEISVRTYFEIRDGKPVIRVEDEARRPSKNYAALEASLRPTRRVQPVFPESMRQQGREARVYVMLEVDAEGKVTSVSGNAYPPFFFRATVRPGGGRVPGAVLFTPSNNRLGHFIDAIEEALKKWQFPPPPTGWDGPRRACYEFNFGFTRKPGP